MEECLDGEELQQLSSEYLLSQPKAGRSVIVTLDGKTVRGTIDTQTEPGVHLLAVYLPEEGLVLAQVAVDSKGNEIVAAPRVLEMVDLRGKVVIGDAMHTQRKLSMQIVLAGGDYVWTVKDNQPKLLWDLQKLFEETQPIPGTGELPKDFRSAKTVNKSRGRIEERCLTASSLLKDYVDWPYLEQVFKLERRFTYLKPPKINSTDAKFSVTVHAQNNGGGTYRAIFNLQTNDGGSQLANIHWYGTTNGLLLGRLYLATHSKKPNYALTAGNWYFITTVWDGTAFKLYINGADVTDSSTSVHGPYFQGFSLGRGYSASYHGVQNVALTMLHSRALDPAEARSLYEEYRSGWPTLLRWHHTLIAGEDVGGGGGVTVPGTGAVGTPSAIIRASMGGSSSRQPMPRAPDRSSAAGASAGSCASTTGRRPEHAGGSGPIVCAGRLGPLICFYHRQAA